MFMLHVIWCLYLNNAAVSYPLFSEPKAYGNARFGQGNRTIGLSQFGCLGTETHLLNCTHTYNSSGVSIDCGHQEDAGVDCLSPCEDNSTKVVDGDLSQGRVLYCVNGQWRTLCSTGWVDNNAETVCRMIGYPAWGEFPE